MIVEKKNAADLLPAEYNPRKDLKPGDLEYEKLKRSIEQFGYRSCGRWPSASSGTDGYGYHGSGLRGCRPAGG